MATDDVQFRIRLNPSLKRKLEGIAAAEGRSLNAEIARRLESSISDFRYTKKEEWVEQLSSLGMWIQETDTQIERLANILTDIAVDKEQSELLKPLIITKMASLQRDRERLFEESLHIKSKINNTVD
ncbi:Arc family DNA-binding protein [Acetobacter orientalis]|uniref:Arc family DNA-binding protein n=1 Tax=Acetobacter orientalis TaxID=146474 RepID=UPI0039E7BA0B